VQWFRRSGIVANKTLEASEQIKKESEEESTFRSKRKGSTIEKEGRRK
jgi:hypothetical protein